MEDLAYEDLFNKIFRYIRLSGVLPTRDSTLAILKLMEELLVIESTSGFDQVMVEVQGRLNPSEILLPLIYPQLNRSSIGYPDE